MHVWIREVNILFHGERKEYIYGEEIGIFFKLESGRQVVECLIRKRVES